MELLILGLLIVSGYFIGRRTERRHYRRLNQREAELQYLEIHNGGGKNTASSEEEGRLYGAGVVIASDLFKTLAAAIRSLFGGRLTSYESLLERGRREAILRLKEKAAEWGAQKIVNVRVETTILSDDPGKNLPCVELYAYGTAIKKQTPHV